MYRVQCVNCRHSKLSILCMHFICFRFCLLYNKLESVEHYLWGKQHHNAIHSFSNLEMACCAAWHSSQWPQYKNFKVLGCQSEYRFTFTLMKTPSPQHGACGWSLAMAMLCFYLSCHITSDSTWKPTLSAWRR